MDIPIDATAAEQRQERTGGAEMALTPEQQAAIRAEIAGDPAGIGYAGLSPVEQYWAITQRPNAITQVTTRRSITRDELRAACGLANYRIWARSGSDTDLGFDWAEFSTATELDATTEFGAAVLSDLVTGGLLTQEQRDALDAATVVTVDRDGGLAPSRVDVVLGDGTACSGQAPDGGDLRRAEFEAALEVSE